MMEKKSKQGLIYRLFRAYLRLVHDKFFYRKVHYLSVGNVPPDGVPVLIASNHQNCLCDPLGILFALTDRKPGFIVRADVFYVNKLFGYLLRKMGLLPAFRLDYEGEASLGKNHATFEEAEKRLVEGGTVVIFPESGHQDKHWLGDFSLAYLRMAFEAAEMTGFEKEIFILPVCNHYSAYFDIQQDFLVRFGKPISLMPYYGLYKSKPRTVQRRVNELVREQIDNMMLNITDMEDYVGIDFLRMTYGRKYAENCGFNPDFLPEKLQADRMFFAALETAKSEKDGLVHDVCQSAVRLDGNIRKHQIRDDLFDKNLGMGKIVLKGLGLLLLFPLWLVSLWPNLLIYKAPKPILNKMPDKMFTTSFLFGLSVLVTIPIFYTLTFVLAGLYVGWWMALGYTLLLPFLGIFAWYYWQWVRRIGQDLRFHRLSQSEALVEMAVIREKMHSVLDHILKKKT